MTHFYTVLSEGQTMFIGTYAQCMKYCADMHFMVYTHDGWQMVGDTAIVQRANTCSPFGPGARFTELKYERK